MVTPHSPEEQTFYGKTLGAGPTQIVHRSVYEPLDDPYAAPSSPTTDDGDSAHPRRLASRRA